MNFLKILIAVLPVFQISTSSLAQQKEENNNRAMNFNVENNTAIKGHDPVAYFSQNKAVKGKPENTMIYKGIIYRFATKENLESFRANPDKYEPQFGGWCAYAMGNDGSRVEVDPETFKILDGKLYLFYNFYFNNTLKKWNSNEKALKEKADKNWKKNFPQ